MNDSPSIAVATPPPACPRCGGAPAGAPEPSTGFVACAGCGSRFDPLQPGTRVGATPDPMPEVLFKAGVMIGDYELIRELGRGGMSTVWAARQARLDRPVAVKVLHPHLALDADLRRRFLREAEALVHLDHPGIVPAIDRGEHAGRPYLVVAYAGERTLREEMLGGDRCPRRLGPVRVAAVARAVLEALAHAHARGLVHRDIKPENLLVDGDGAVRVADFGIAQLDHGLDGRTLTRLTGIGTVLGTIGYMAPEQADGGLALDARADLYAVGVVCYEALAGHLPIGRFEEPAHLLGDLPEAQRAAWNNLVLALLERSPNRRPKDATAALALLDAVEGVGQAAVAPPVVSVSIDIRERSRAAATTVRDWWHEPIDLGAYPHGRRLMRPRVARSCFGLCAGLGVWSGIDAGWWRLALVVTTLCTSGLALIVYGVAAALVPACECGYQPLPLNHRLPHRPYGAWLGVCALLGRTTPISAGIWRLIAVVGTLCFGITVIGYLILGIVLPREPGREASAQVLFNLTISRATAVPDDGRVPSWAHKRFALMIALGLAAAAWVVDARGDAWQGDHRAIGATIGWSTQPIEPVLWWAAIVVGLMALLMRSRPRSQQARPPGALAGLVVAGGVIGAVGLALALSHSPLGGQQVAEALIVVGVGVVGVGALAGAVVGWPGPVRCALVIALGLGGTLAMRALVGDRADMTALAVLGWIACAGALGLGVVATAARLVRGGVFATRILGFAAVVGFAFAIAAMIDGDAGAGLARLAAIGRAGLGDLGASPWSMLGTAALAVAAISILVAGSGRRPAMLPGAVEPAPSRA